MTVQVTIAGVSTAQVQSRDILSVCFSPGGNCANQVVYWIGRANSSIHILIYSFTLDSIGNALIQAKQNKPNLDIRIVWDESSSKETGSEYQKLLNAGFQIHVDHRSGLLHDKVAIIDGHVIITGSFNWTNSANDTNRENLLVLDNPSIAFARAGTFDQWC
jgi:phosphatidylserine/phosphatidylglycerophosphate/cardiolipin synthase-like enzyme